MVQLARRQILGSMDVETLRHRACLFALFFAIFAALGVTRAAASPFCPADVVFMTPWDYTSDGPSAGDQSQHYVIQLKDAGEETLSGHVTLAGDRQLYRVAFPTWHFIDTSTPTSDPDPLGDEFAADSTLISLPQIDAIRYAWVSDVTDADGKVTKCPIFPYALKSLTDSQRKEMTTAHPPNVRVAYASLAAKLDSSLPAASCPQPYREAAPDGEGPGYTRIYDPSITKRPIVYGAAAIDQTGKATMIAILGPSGSQVYDNAARQEFSVRKYKPALFNCQPAVGIYFFRMQYYPGD